MVEQDQAQLSVHWTIHVEHVHGKQGALDSGGTLPRQFGSTKGRQCMAGWRGAWEDHTVG